MSTEAISRGILSNGTLVAHYYTSEPSPDQWVAVGTVMFWQIPHEGGFPRWLLVGTGRTEKLAVASLRARLREASPPRWKIKCDLVAQGDRDARVDALVVESGGYVVPWEMRVEDATEPFGVEEFESSPV